MCIVFYKNINYNFQCTIFYQYVVLNQVVLIINLDIVFYTDSTPQVNKTVFFSQQKQTGWFSWATNWKWKPTSNEQLKTCENQLFSC